MYLAKYKAYVLAASMQYDELPGADESDNPDMGDLLIENHVRSGPYPMGTGQRQTLIV